jgi:hypothetical protein
MLLLCGRIAGSFRISKEGRSHVTDTIKAVVGTIRKGHKGSFAIATAEGIEGSVTFSLKKGVWKEKGHPKKGDSIFLSDLRQTNSGWRALSARFWKPSDEQQKQPKQRKALP